MLFSRCRSKELSRPGQILLSLRDKCHENKDKLSLQRDSNDSNTELKSKVIFYFYILYFILFYFYLNFIFYLYRKKVICHH